MGCAVPAFIRPPGALSHAPPAGAAGQTRLPCFGLTGWEVVLRFARPAHTYRAGQRLSLTALGGQAVFPRRQCLLGGTTPRNPPLLGGPIPPDPPWRAERAPVASFGPRS